MIKQTDYSFDESLKYIDDLALQVADGTVIPVSHSMDWDELPTKKVVSVYCVAMYVKVTSKISQEGKLKEYAFFGAMSQILEIVQSASSIRHIGLQADSGLLVLFDTPMKKDVEDLINLAAQVRSINEVVLRKLHIGLNEQVVAIGLDYGLCSYFATGNPEVTPLCSGNPIRRAKRLAEMNDDCVNISDDIYVNLTEETKKGLFANQAVDQGMKYYHSQLINLRMRRWVAEHS